MVLGPCRIPGNQVRLGGAQTNIHDRNGYSDQAQADTKASMAASNGTRQPSPGASHIGLWSHCKRAVPSVAGVMPLPPSPAHRSNGNPVLRSAAGPISLPLLTPSLPSELSLALSTALIAEPPRRRRGQRQQGDARQARHTSRMDATNQDDEDASLTAHWHHPEQQQQQHSADWSLLLPGHSPSPFAVGPGVDAQSPVHSKPSASLSHFVGGHGIVDTQPRSVWNPPGSSPSPFFAVRLGVDAQPPAAPNPSSYPPPGFPTTAASNPSSYSPVRPLLPRLPPLHLAFPLNPRPRRPRPLPRARLPRHHGRPNRRHRSLHQKEQR